MKNRDIYQRDPSKITLLNNGVSVLNAHVGSAVPAGAARPGG